MKEKISRSYLYVLGVTSGVFLGIGFIWPFLWPLGFVGVALLIYSISESKTTWQASLLGFVIATVKSLVVLSLFWSVYPIRWLDLNLGNMELPLIGFYWITVSLFLSFGGAILAATFWQISKRVNLFLGGILFSLLLVLSEVVGALTFSFFTLGPGGSINTLYSLGSLGYLFGYNSPFIALASWGGVYVLSFVFALAGYLIWIVYLSFKLEKTFVFAAIFILLMSYSSLNNSPEPIIDSENKVTVAVIDTRFGDDFFQREDKDAFKSRQINEAVESALSFKSDYIILPEDSRYTPANMSPEIAYKFFRFKNSDPKTILIDSGSLTASSGDTFLRATIYDGVSKKSWVADKQYLVPQGEYLPYFYSRGLELIGMKKAAEEISKKLPFRSGPISSQANFPNYVPAILFCFESSDPLSIRRLVKDREVPFVAHIVSHAWFHESEVLWQQLDSMLKIQAVWNKVPIISAGNMVKGSMYTRVGEKIQKSPVASGESWEVSLFEL